MKSGNLYLLLIVIILFSACEEEPIGEPIDFVDPFIGTDAHGHTFPGATTPFGMIQLSPSNDFKAWDWCSGYHYSDGVIKGFAHTHISGAGLAGLGDILLMPTSGDLKLVPGTEEDPESGFRSRFSHKNESASAGYYSVLLEDYNILAELTTTTRVGFHKYTSEDGGTMNIIVDPSHQIMEKVFKTEIEILSNTEIKGLKHSKGEAGDRHVYFYAKFSKPFASSGIAINDSILNTNKAEGIDVRSFVKFDMQPNESIEVKLSLSFVSYAGAKKNFMAEASTLSFAQALHLAQKSWKEKLSKIEINGTTLQQKRIFYTGIYHSFISPNIISDVDGKYVVEGQEFQSNIPQYSNYSTWDTYRALHPLFTIIEHDKTKDFVNSLASRYHESEVGLPVWELLGHDNICMIGYNTVSPMADAVLKDIEGIDSERVFEAIKAASNSLEKNSPNYDKNGMEEYLLMGFVPGELNCGVSKTTEQNYYDWCISQVAEKLGKEEDSNNYKKRSIGYRNLYNPETKFLNSIYTTGEWRKINPKIWDDLIGNYVSGNMWGYSSYVPHDVSGLMELMGGKEEFANWLDNIFTDTSSTEGTLHVDISGFIGKYGHGDEPSHHMPYLYNYVGQPWKTQKYVNQVIESFYSDKPDGLINNEDLGQMSAWYIFSSMGFYPVCPGDKKYILGAPLHKEVNLKLENGNIFKVTAKKNSSKNKYVQSVNLNGAPYSKSYITHETIMNGGELVFEMGNKPNYEFAVADEDLPISKVDVQSNISVKDIITYKPFDSNSTIVFEGARMIELQCNTDDAKVFYTTDGSEPSQKSKIYTSPIEITKSIKLKAKAYKGDLLPSYTYEREYFRGRNFKDLKNKPVLTLEVPAGSYGHKDGSQLLDLVTGTPHFGDGKWTGWNGQDLIATIDFGEEVELEDLSLGYLVNTGVWIFPPKQIIISVSNHNKNFKVIADKSITISKNHSTDPYIVRDGFNLKNASGRYLKVEAKNRMQIPAWHGASGHAPWMFIDEILIN